MVALQNEEAGHGRTGNGVTFFKRGVGRKFWTLLVILLAVALAAMSVALVVKAKEDKNDKRELKQDQVNTTKKPDVCTTADCVEAAYGVISKMDTSVDPCDDFYQFSCGSWLKANVIPHDKASYSIYDVIRDRVALQIKDLLEAPITNKDTDYVIKAKAFYASCIDYDRINRLGPMPLMQKIKEYFGGWPLTNPNWNRGAATVSQLLIKMMMKGFRGMIGVGIGPDIKDSTKRRIMIDQPEFMLERDYYLVDRNSTILQTYRELIFQIGKVYGFARPATARNEVNEIVDFETTLANISAPIDERRDMNRLYNPTTLGSISKKYSNIIDWKRMINSMLNNMVNTTDITDDEIIINSSPSYFEKLNKLIKDTDARIVVNYLVWRIVNEMAHSQGDQINNLYIPYNKMLHGSITPVPRYVTCVKATDGTMPNAVGKMFVEKHFDAETKTLTQAMVTNLRQALDQLFDKVDWVDDQTRQKTKEKGKYITEHIGYPEIINNETALVEMYKHLNFVADDYMGNIFKNKVLDPREGLKDLRHPVENSKTEYKPTEINAFYDPEQNQIIMTAAILQPPYFSKSYTHALNYGGMGTVIGHELTHAFDDHGSQYDKDGNVVQWWTNSTLQKFRSKSQCMVNQYSGYTVNVGGKLMNVDGINTLGENIADNGGVKEAFMAYRNLIAKAGKEEKPLPGLAYNSNQLFYISFGQSWCSNYSDSAKVRQIRYDPHSPHKYRVNGVLQNDENFSRVFGCSTRSKMNPKKKCSVW